MSTVPLHDYVMWLADELDNIKNNMYYNVEDSTIDLKWLFEDENFYINDVSYVADYLSKHFREKEAHCILEISSKYIGLPTSNIDIFFWRIHLSGHILIDELGIEFSSNETEQLAISEIISLYFSVLCCKRYFNLKHLTREMAKILLSAQVALLNILKYEIESLDMMPFNSIDAALIIFKEMMKYETKILQ